MVIAGVLAAKVRASLGSSQQAGALCSMENDLYIVIITGAVRNRDLHRRRLDLVFGTPFQTPHQ